MLLQNEKHLNDYLAEEPLRRCEAPCEDDGRPKLLCKMAQEQCRKQQQKVTFELVETSKGEQLGNVPADRGRTMEPHAQQERELLLLHSRGSKVNSL